MARLKESRTMKVCEQSGYNYKSTPTIMLKGQWLKECGFDIGTKIVVQCENGKLTITSMVEEPMIVDVTANKVAKEQIVYGKKRGRK